ncbi:PQQ-like beta-propeller repeat protein [Abyssibius alkaniclasticus]|uniref:outer membrane protein assembly factor BamB family protein n=1 Tax=Abyssibius alkaniclasticus TaxID=2881234 RepID=UPI0023646628|nr:PQQ-like beta-propeller repeat protein [Abyssibius alkaniclasticus]UPH70493.1 PQQ-like beta-propeller repeat protein [Abyssibius alkaniclasticus]
MVKTKSGFLVAALIAVTAVSGCGKRDVILPGERLSIRPNADIQVQNASAGVALGAPVSNADWAQGGGNATHQMPHLALSATPSLRYSVDIGRGDSRRTRLTSAPVVAGGVVYTMDTESLVRAFGPGGVLLWENNITPIADNPGDGFGGGLAVAGERLIATTGFGQVVALGTTSGDVLWRYDLDAPLRAAPTIADNRIYVMTRAEKAYALSLNGALEWTLQGPTAGAPYTLAAAAPAVAGGVVALPYSTGQVIGAATNGQGRWATTVNAGAPSESRSVLGDFTGGPVIANGRIFISNQNGETAALSLQGGGKLWSQPIGAMSSPAVLGGALFMVTDDARLVRLNASNGAALWAVQLPKWNNPDRRRGFIAHFGPVIAGGVLWVAGADGQLRGFDPQSGAQVHSVAIPGGAATAPVVAQGVLYVLGRNGTLNAFQ